MKDIVIMNDNDDVKIREWRIRVSEGPTNVSNRKVNKKKEVSTTGTKQGPVEGLRGQNLRCDTMWHISRPTPTESVREGADGSTYIGWKGLRTRERLSQKTHDSGSLKNGIRNEIEGWLSGKNTSDFFIDEKNVLSHINVHWGMVNILKLNY